MAAPIKVAYPSWHDDARKDKAEGMATNKLADKYGVSASRITQVTSWNWQLYLMAGKPDLTKQGRTLGQMGDLLRKGGFVFEPYPAEPPSKAEATRKVPIRKPTKMPEVQEVAPLREFKAIRRYLETEGKTLKGAEIKCSKCGKVEQYFNNQGSVSTEHLPKEFERLGWMVGKNERTDTCPSCLAKLRGEKIKDFKDLAPTPIIPKAEGIPSIAKKPEGIEAIPNLEPVLKQVAMPTLNTTTSIPASVQPSMSLVEKKPTTQANVDKAWEVPKPDDRKMTRADDQIIYLRLMDVYVDERSGYKDDWTDIKVAADLSVPVEWVALIRDRSFGPETNATLRDRQTKALADKAGEIERLIVIADKKMEALQNLDNKVQDVIKQIEAQIDRFEELTKSLVTEDKHVENIVKQFDDTVAAYRKMVDETKPMSLAS